MVYDLELSLHRGGWCGVTRLCRSRSLGDLVETGFNPPPTHPYGRGCLPALWVFKTLIGIGPY